MEVIDVDVAQTINGDPHAAFPLQVCIRFDDLVCHAELAAGFWRCRAAGDLHFDLREKEWIGGERPLCQKRQNCQNQSWLS